MLADFDTYKSELWIGIRPYAQSQIPAYALATPHSLIRAFALGVVKAKGPRPLKLRHSHHAIMRCNIKVSRTEGLADADASFDALFITQVH